MTNNQSRDETLERIAIALEGIDGKLQLVCAGLFAYVQGLNGDESFSYDEEIKRYDTKKRTRR